jgi:hypothetical protein
MLCVRAFWMKAGVGCLGSPMPRLMWAVLGIRCDAGEQLAQLFEGVGVQSFEVWIHGVTKSDDRCEKVNYSEAGPMLLWLGMQ